ncbi:CsbD family protein [Solitalea koreensis]|uniref:General stress protein CsbD n=1 Tax=Solitalea koreensis TaxID=543615 RepID=A0A521EHD3_9SPHI|nr:hypothetical protein [Solitalea koreensis]SMO82580.1 hypothetical protein SAMN06265350_11435 [Solitalea koreensis]
MGNLVINGNWDKIKTKIKRKYNNLTDDELTYVNGQEEELVTRLMKLLNKDRTYVEFMLSKMQSNLDNNRL